MKKKFYIFLPLYLAFFIILGVYEVSHPPLSTDSAKIGNYEVQVTTTPAVPEVGKDTTIHFRVLDQGGNEVDKFRMGLKIYYNDELLHIFPPANHNNGIWDVDYVFEESGNHVFRVDLHDLHSGDETSYTFNITTLNAYGTLFGYLVIAGVAGAVGILIAIVIFQKWPRTKYRL